MEADECPESVCVGVNGFFAVLLFLQILDECSEVFGSYSLLLSSW